MEKSISLRALWLIAIAVLLSAWFSVLPLRDAATMLPVSDFKLVVSPAYIVFAPWLNILDMMTTLSLSQHVAWMLAVWVLAVLLVWRWLQTHVCWHAIWRLLAALCFGFVWVVALYAIAMLMPRPMSALQVPDKNMLVVDFHSHTDASHDANKWFNAEDNRWWHEHAGFHAAFVTDHSTFLGIQAGKQKNAKRAGDGVQLLDGVEVFHDGGHVLALCATELIQQKNSYIWKQHKPQPCATLLVQALPAPLSDSLKTFQTRHIEAIEVHDGAPIGLELIKVRQQLLKKAKALDIALVSGSDNHGWAYAASGWSVLRISGWQAMNAKQLAFAITQHIRKSGFTAIQVVERNMLLPASSIWEHITMPVRLLWHIWQTISWAERLSWLVWLLFIGLTLRWKSAW